MISPEERLIRAQRRCIREKDEQIAHLQELTWLLSGGQYEKPKPIKITIVHPFEEVKSGPQDGFLRTLLTE